jgi:hypothetical protein
MGLDVYLYHSTDRKAAKAAEEEYEAKVDAEYEHRGGYGKLTKQDEEELKEFKTKLAEELGCTGEYNQHKSVTKIREDSKLYPEHMFNIGYFRSSYNDGGIENVLRQLKIGGLYEIFDVQRDDYEFTPDWQASLERATESIDKYRAHLASDFGELSIHKFSHNPLIDPKELPGDESAALEVFKAQWKRHLEIKAKSPQFDSGNYGSREGDFFLGEPLEVLAVINGAEKSILGSLYGKPDAIELVQYAVVRSRKAEPGKVDWYLQALEITREAIQWVLAQPDPQNYYFHWSS